MSPVSVVNGTSLTSSPERPVLMTLMAPLVVVTLLPEPEPVVPKKIPAPYSASPVMVMSPLVLANAPSRTFTPVESLPVAVPATTMSPTPLDTRLSQTCTP